VINGVISVSGNDITLFWIVLIGYMAVLVVIGIYSKKKTKSVEDYLTAGRSIGPLLLGLSFGVTYFSSVLIIGGGGLAFFWGLASVWIAAIDVLVGVVLVFLFFGRRTKILSDKCKALTISQLIGYRYQDKNYQAFSGAVVMFFEMIYMVSMYVGLSKLLILLVPSDWSAAAVDNAYVIAVSLCAIITVVYLTAGGSFGAIYSDAFESVIMIVGVVVIAIYGLIAVGGLDGMISGLDIGETIGAIVNPDTSGTFLIPFKDGSLTTFIGFGGMGILGYILVTSFGQWGMPQALTRFFTSKSKKAVKYAAGIAALWACVCAFFAWFNGALAGSYWFLGSASYQIQILTASSFPCSRKTSR